MPKWPGSAGPGGVATTDSATTDSAWVITGPSSRIGDESGEPMVRSVQVQDPAFVDRVVAETRALLGTVPDDA